MGPEFDPFLVPLSIAIFPEGSENGRILGLHFGAGEPLSSSFLESHNLDAERPFLQRHAAGRTPKCSQLMLALNTYSFQTIKLKLAAFLPSAAPTYSCGSIFFYICSDCKPQNFVAVVVHESATAQEAVLLDGVAA